MSRKVQDTASELSTAREWFDERWPRGLPLGQVHSAVFVTGGVAAGLLLAGDSLDCRWREYARLRFEHPEWTKTRCCSEAGYAERTAKTKATKLENQERVKALMKDLEDPPGDDPWAGFNVDVIPQTKEDALRRIEAKQWELAASPHGPTAARALEYLGKIYRLEEQGGKAKEASSFKRKGPMSKEEALRLRAADRNG